jgi:phage-related protein
MKSGFSYRFRYNPHATMASAEREAASLVQFGKQPPNAKPWQGLGAGVWELAEQDASGTYRAVYTIRFAKAIYVLHAFQKKSPTGIRTSRKDIALIGQRLRAARHDYEARYGEEED